MCILHILIMFQFEKGQSLYYSITIIVYVSYGHFIKSSVSRKNFTQVFGNIYINSFYLRLSVELTLVELRHFLYVTEIY